jgi:hypothetical protein
MKLLLHKLYQPQLKMEMPLEMLKRSFFDESFAKRRHNTPMQGLSDQQYF